MKKIVIAGDMLDEGFESLYHDFNVVKPAKGFNFTRSELLEEIVDADVLVAFFSAKVDKELIDKAQKLKIISNFGVGYDNIDSDYAAEKGIVVTNTPAPVTIPTAELAFSLMLGIARKLSYLDNQLRVNSDYNWGILNNLGVTLYGKTLGIFGMGRIGKEVAVRAKAFGMNIIYHNRNRVSADVESELGVKYVEFEDLLKESDFLSLNAPSTPETRGKFTLEGFKLMKPTSFVINTSRGNLIKEKDLIFALKNSIIQGAAIDVYEGGDGNISKELFELENVILTPHIGTQTVDARIEMGKYASENIILFFEGKEPLSRVK